MIRLSNIIAPKAEYAVKARAYLNAWFVNEQTKMKPSLKYGQASKGEVVVLV
ncbi:MAG: alginate lyase family protein [Thalassotalea sp.]